MGGLEFLDMMFLSNVGKQHCPDLVVETGWHVQNGACGSCKSDLHAIADLSVGLLDWKSSSAQPQNSMLTWLLPTSLRIVWCFRGPLPTCHRYTNTNCCCPQLVSEITLQNEFCTNLSAWRYEFRCEFLREFQDEYFRSIWAFEERVQWWWQVHHTKSTAEFTAKFTRTTWGKIHRFLLLSGSGNNLHTIRESFCESGEGVRLPRERGWPPGKFGELPGKFGELLGKFGKLPGNPWIAV